MGMMLIYCYISKILAPGWVIGVIGVIKHSVGVGGLFLGGHIGDQFNVKGTGG